MPSTKSSPEQTNGISAAVPPHASLENSTNHHANGLTPCNGSNHTTDHQMKLGSQELPLNGAGPTNGSIDPGTKCDGAQTQSPEPKVGFNESIPLAKSGCNGGALCEDSNVGDSGVKDVNPTLWLGEDQMLLLPGNGRSEETDSNSGTSDTKSFEGLLSPNGTSILWDEDTDWILLFDNMIRYADRKQQRTTRSCGCRGPKTEDESHSTLQSTLPKSTSKRASSAPPSRRGMLSSSKSIPSSTGGGAGGTDEEMFMKSFENVPRITIYSAKDLESELTKIKEVLGNPSNDWGKRVESVKAVRSLILAGGQDYDEFYPYLRHLELPFQTCVKDLRSQVVREACITIAYLSQQLGTKLDHFAEALLPCLINLIQNSAKIMSTAGIVAIRFIIRYTHVNRLVPIITSHLTSKSKDIRRTCFEFLNQLLVTWPTHPLEKHVTILTDAIRKGISDADADARACCRKAFWSFADHFRDQADSLLNSLDNSKQRMLHDAYSMSTSSSNSSLTQNGKSCRSHGSNSVGSVESLSPGRSSTLGRRTGISNLPTSKLDPSSGIPTRLRSTSAIDLAAVRRAKARSAYSTIANLPRGSGASLPRAASKRNDYSLQGMSSPERVIQSRPRGSSRSQPSSRPESPSSRLSYATYLCTTDSKHNKNRSKSGIPVPTSRDASPSRATFAHERRLSGSRSRLTSAGEKFLSPSPSPGPLMTEKTLQQSREAEVAVADALRTHARRRYNAFEDQSDESETSSICSDRSFGSFGKNVDDINEVINSLHSIHWSDRKDGLQALHGYFRSGRTLSLLELKKVTDIFSKIFMDPHTKVFSLFLDTLNELIIVHKNDLHAWLYILLTRLFLKTGCDILGSVLSKIQRTLELIKESFPCEHQFNAIVRFLNDQTQTPNTKVKTALLKYLHSLICIMDPSKFSSANPEVCAAFMKIISWTASPKCSDLRKHGEDVLVALFGLNPSEYSNFIDQLPKGYKDSAFQLLHSRYPRSNPDTPRSFSNQASPSSVLTQTLSPNSSLPWTKSQGGTPQNCSFDFDDTENLNPEEISDCWKKTVSEIEGFKSDDFYNKVPEKYNMDPGVHSLGSQLSSPESRFDNLELNSSNGSSPTKISSSECSSLNFPCSDAPLMLNKELEEVSSHVGNAIDGSLSTHNQKTIYSIINELNEDSKEEKKVKALDCLICLSREQSSIISQEDFRIILREVIHTVADTSLPVKTLALQALCELIKSKTEYFQDYIELTLLRILEAHKDTEVDVLMMADMCTVVAAASLPPEQCVRILNALILTEPLPVNQAAIKMMSKLVEHHSEQVVLKLLPDIMPGLLKAYDNQESTVRKAAVFCMVAVHRKVGEAMQPHLASLNSCKIKLLNVYIKKAEQPSSSCNGSPGSSNKLPSLTTQ